MTFESDRLVDLIKHKAGDNDAAYWEALKNRGQAWKQTGLDAHVTTVRLLYEGQVEPILREHVKARFPQSGDKIPLVPFNWAKLYAENGAAVYDRPPLRHLERDGERLEAEAGDEGTKDGQRADGEDATRARDFATMLKEAQIDVVMAEAERRVLLAKTVFLRVRSDSLEAKATGLPPRTVVDIFWPSDVLVIPHPRCPTSIAAAVCVMFRVSGDDGVQATGTTWEVWRRPFDEDEDGEVTKFGPWSAELVCERVEGEGHAARKRVTVKPMKWAGSEVYPLPTLPAVAWHAGIPQGSPFLDCDRNLVGIFNSINEAIGSEKLAVEMNAATPLVRISDRAGPASLGMGPGLMPTIHTDEQIVPVQLNANFDGIRNSIRGLQANLAITNRQPVDGLDVEAGSAPESGVARQIKNEPQSKARREAVARAVEVETRPVTGLLAIMVEVHDHFRATQIAGEGIVYVMTPQDPPEYESGGEKLRNAIDALDAGLCTKAEARVRAGLSRSVEEAKAAIAQIEQERSEGRPNGLLSALDGIGRRPFGREQPDDADIEGATRNGPQREP